MGDAALREALVSHLRRSGTVRTARVAAALGKVPRHRFIPDLPMAEAYADRAVALKTDGDEILSSVSQPGMLAQMLELLAPALGDRVLEIGTGTGYNAALLCELVGSTGSVTTVELDEEIAAFADDTLHGLGYENARVVAGDGGDAAATERQSFDRVVVSARTDDIAETWWNALAEHSRIVIPLRLESAGEYAVGFEFREGRLASVGACPCAFIGIRGSAVDKEKSEIFYRDPDAGHFGSTMRRIEDVQAVRRPDATPELLDRADVVIARPVTVFAISFA